MIQFRILLLLASIALAVPATADDTPPVDGPGQEAPEQGPDLRQPTADEKARMDALDRSMRDAFMAGYKAAAGFAREALNEAPRMIPEGARV